VPGSSQEGQGEDSGAQLWVRKRKWIILEQRVEAAIRGLQLKQKVSETQSQQTTNKPYIAVPSCNPSYAGGIGKRFTVQDSPGQNTGDPT
jgi:hypothetical protein